MVLVTGAGAPADLAADVRAGLSPDVLLLLVLADGWRATMVSRAKGARLLGLRTLDELPRALVAAVQGVG